jgi:3' exoribonuclease, RNase T-like
MKYPDMMIDIETMGTAPGCPILSVAALLFDSRAPLTGDESAFHFHVDLGEEIAAGAVPSASTILWWMTQAQGARDALLAGQDRSASMAQVIHDLQVWVGAHYGSDPVVWCLPAGFDFPLLRAAAVRAGVELPWNHWDERCLRTLAKEYPGAIRPKPELAHDALSDARAQAQWLVNIRAEQRRLQQGDSQ